MSSAPASTVTVTLTTSAGEIRLELDAARAPVSTANFVDYVSSGHYDGTVFHRVIPGFMVQGGGMTADLASKPTRAPIKNEAKNGLKNLRGTIAMARTSVVDSATSQFFINVADNGFLDHGGRDYGYAVFGKIVVGMEVVDQIVKTPTGRQAGHSDVPLTPITILKATLA